MNEIGKIILVVLLGLLKIILKLCKEIKSIREWIINFVFYETRKYLKLYRKILNGGVVINL